jgi:predicted secreted protein
MNSWMFRLARAACLLLTVNSATAADPVDKTAHLGTEVLLRAEAELMLPNDEVRIVLFAHEQSAERSKAISLVNRRVKGAIEAIKTLDASARIDSGAYASNAVYGQRKATGPSELLAWEARQSITVTTAKVEGVADLVGKVQVLVDVATVDFGLSRDTQRKADAKLFDMAFDDLHARLANVARLLGRTEQDVDIEQIDLTGNDGVPRMRAMAAPMMAAKGASLEQPRFEPGESRQAIAFTAHVRVRH